MFLAKLGFLLSAAAMFFPDFLKRLWYVAFAPFLVSIVTGAYCHSWVHLAVGLALAIPVAYIGSIILVLETRF